MICIFPMSVVSEHITIPRDHTANLIRVLFTDRNTVFNTKVNTLTEYIGQECNGRIFTLQTYTHEVYSIEGPRQSYLILRNTPVFTLTSFQWRSYQQTSSTLRVMLELLDQWPSMNHSRSPLLSTC